MKDGGQAFPVIEQLTQSSLGGQYAVEGSPGMSLRDYFAARAMQAMLCSNTDNGRFNDDATAARTAGFAYIVADAMLARRDLAAS